jgi:hypothetical protein
MKALSLKQPWANLIRSRSKTIETRTWSTRYRGPVLICASRTVDQGMAAMYERGTGCEPYELGHAICVATILECRPMTPADEERALCLCTPGRFAWILANVVRIKPFPVKGRLSLFEVAIPEGHGE